ncbi:diacylglycerol kinase [Halomonas piscis]|uniref:Diacylglycerol kinase n=1 Tax=Halomonas piscis TaxID=3031727 RepID=A0ABY9YY75_9GAMM|nr:diacylglycerol kinase [Halomonas piscis]WNK19717.1 diacylglycerol kinase [Halomonas piscis]
MKPERTGFSHLLHSTRYSFNGLIAAFRHETAFRQEVALSVVLIPLAVWLGQSATQVLLLIGSCVLVMVAELLNSAVENVVDRIGTEHHELSGRAKDIGSAAVMLALGYAALVWGLMLWLRFWG